MFHILKIRKQKETFSLYCSMQQILYMYMLSIVYYINTTHSMHAKYAFSFSVRFYTFYSTSKKNNIVWMINCFFQLLLKKCASVCKFREISLLFHVFLEKRKIKKIKNKTLQLVCITFVCQSIIINNLFSSSISWSKISLNINHISHIYFYINSKLL